MPHVDKDTHNDYMRKYILNRYHKRREAAIVTLGSKCVSCSSIENLELDHKNFKDKEFSISSLWSCSKAKYDQELLKCQLLCNKCHRAKSNLDLREIKTGQREIQHGQHWTYKKYGCRCEECCKANSAKIKFYHRNRNKSGTVS